MSLVIPAGTGQVALEHRNSADPDPWYVTYGVDLMDAGGSFEDVCIDQVLAWSSTFLESMHTSTTLVACHLKVGQDGGPPLIVTYNSGNTGTTTTSKLPQNCALLVSKGTDQGGRANRGRFFVPNVLDENSVSQTGVIDALSVQAFQGVANDFLQQLEEGDATPGTPMVILHNPRLAAPLPEPTTVTRLTVDSLISTQRRRLR